MLAEPPRPTRSIFQARCYRVPDLLSDRRVPAAATRSPGKADEQIRTADLLITNQLLYQLSYVGLRRKSASNGLLNRSGPHFGPRVAQPSSFLTGKARNLASPAGTGSALRNRHPSHPDRRPHA
jgi:hypothetical protein